MFQKPHCPVIALEEHYWDDELEKTYTGGETGRPGEQYTRLKDLGALRLKEMDEAAIDTQVLSHGAPSTQKLPAETAAALAKRVNDRLHQVVKANPARFAAFAALPTAVPEAAADEFERTAALGFKGAMLHGLANGTFLDDKRFWPIYARAEKLDLPIYMHPSLPQADVMRIYYDDYVKDFPMITRATWGYTVETAILALRLVLSGVFEKYPNLKIILGHLGETLPFLIWRIDTTLKRPGGKAANFRDIFCNNSTSPRAAIFPIRRCFAASWKWASTVSCSRWTGHSCRTRRRPNGWNPCRCATRTRLRSCPATPSGCCGCDCRVRDSLHLYHTPLHAKIEAALSLYLLPHCHGSIYHKGEWQVMDQDLERLRRIAAENIRYERQLSRVRSAVKQTSCISEAVTKSISNLTSGNRSFVIYGEPQSGKTEMMICLTAKLIEIGYDVVDHLLNDSVQLLQQNLDRFQRSGLSPSARNFSEIMDPQLVRKSESTLYSVRKIHTILES
jgi:predicted TIM-barrel fold metal-dependent hydrolase